MNRPSKLPEKWDDDDLADILQGQQWRGRKLCGKGGLPRNLARIYLRRIFFLAFFLTNRLHRPNHG